MLRILPVVAVILLVGCSAPSSAPSSTTLLAERHVSYRVVSVDTGFDLTYRNGSGGSEQTTQGSKLKDAAWTEDYIMRPGSFAYVSAQLLDSGTVTCWIFADGRSIAQARAEGDYKIATCSVRVP